MNLKDFLMVCGDTDMTITDTQDKTLCSGSSSYKELANYENWDIVDITTNGYEKIFVVIEQSKESKESKDSSKGIMEMCADVIAEKDKRIAELEEQLKNAIVPKFKIGQKVYKVYTPNQKYPFEFKIIGFKITKSKGENNIFYNVEEDGFDMG